MKANDRKQSRKISETPLYGRKHTSHEADRELDHLRKILGILIAEQDGSFPLGPAYWFARLRELRLGYALLPAQLAQISALERSVEALAERDNQNIARSKRRFA